MSEPIDDGGSAFPFGQISEITGQPINGYFSAGMSLRAWLAGQALAGALANPHASGDVDANIDLIARGACMLADAVIAELKGGSE